MSTGVGRLSLVLCVDEGNSEVLNDGIKEKICANQPVVSADTAGVVDTDDGDVGVSRDIVASCEALGETD